MKKNKKGETIYSEEIFFPAEFRVRHELKMALIPWPVIGLVAAWMPMMMMGWVQDEVHLQLSYQSLQ